MPLSRRPATLVALLGALAACGPREGARVTTPAADLLISVRGGAVAAPDSIGAGWTRVRVEEDGAGHILVVFRLPTDADPAAFLAALDTAPATPPPAVALGGPEIGETGEVVIELTPGRYVIGCVRRGPEGHRHASTGEARVLVVTSAPASAGRETPPPATQTVQMVDYAYLGAERWRAGPHMLRVENLGRQEHQLRLVRLRPGSSLEHWLKAENPGELAIPVAGVARLGPGAAAYLPVELPAGAYVAYCLVTDPASGRPHVALGMLRALQVE